MPTAAPAPRKPRSNPTEYITIPGVAPSAKLREEWAGKHVLVSVSRGKDSLASLLAARDSGINVYPYHLSHIPGLPLITESLADLEQALGMPIPDLPHPTFWRWLRESQLQPPERWETLMAANLPRVSYEDVRLLMCAHYGLDPETTYTLVGIRAGDSTMRARAIAKNGPVNHKRKAIWPVWDWKIAHIHAALRQHNVTLPEDYRLFGRSYDGLSYMFSGPLAKFRPKDWAVVQQWFPLVGTVVDRAAL